jgi:hypothetical protein
VKRLWIPHKEVSGRSHVQRNRYRFGRIKSGQKYIETKQSIEIKSDADGSLRSNMDQQERFSGTKHDW